MNRSITKTGVLLITLATTDLTYGVPQDAGSDPTAQEKTALAVTVCPQYSWMNWGSYCSYYAQEAVTCNPASFDSTSCSLLTGGSCMSASTPPCLQTIAVGKTVTRLDDPGDEGYGQSKKYRLAQDRIPGSLNRPGHEGEPLIAEENFLIRFRNPNGGRPIFAQIVIAEVEPDIRVARGWEIHNPYRPFQDPNATVTPDTGRPHAFLYPYTPTGGGGAMQIQIITHNSTAGHDD